jgi:hypothetical protein
MPSILPGRPTGLYRATHELSFEFIDAPDFFISRIVGAGREGKAFALRRATRTPHYESERARLLISVALYSPSNLPFMTLSLSLFFYLPDLWEIMTIVLPKPSAAGVPEKNDRNPGQSAPRWARHE